jgi:hypothetical protein
MVKIENLGTRSFMVSPEEVVKGGRLSDTKQHVYIDPKCVIDVNDACANRLSNYPELRVISRRKDKSSEKDD